MTEINYLKTRAQIGTELATFLDIAEEESRQGIDYQFEVATDEPRTFRECSMEEVRELLSQFLERKKPCFFLSADRFDATNARWTQFQKAVTKN
jgi:hypothetical protein